MWEIIQLSHHDKLSDRLVTQLQHNFNTTSTQLQHNFNTTHTLFQHLFQHLFHTSFNNLWNNSSTHFHHILSQFFHNKLFKTWSQNFHSQFMMQYFITTIEWQTFIHNIHQTLLTNFLTNFRTFISQQTLIYCRDINDRCFITLQQLHHNISSQNISSHSSTNISTNISTNYNTVLHQNM